MTRSIKSCAKLLLGHRTCSNHVLSTTRNERLIIKRMVLGVPSAFIHNLKQCKMLSKEVREKLIESGACIVSFPNQIQAKICTERYEEDKQNTVLMLNSLQETRESIDLLKVCLSKLTDDTRELEDILDNWQARNKEVINKALGK